MVDIASQILLVMDPKEYSVELPCDLSTPSGERIVRLAITCGLGPLKHSEAELRSSMQMRIRYIYDTGAVHATEWVETSLAFRRTGPSWQCCVGPGWCWWSDWPDWD